VHFGLLGINKLANCSTVDPLKMHENASFAIYFVENFPLLKFGPLCGTVDLARVYLSATLLGAWLLLQSPVKIRALGFQTFAKLLRLWKVIFF
jgi:hypothetical protein